MESIKIAVVTSTLFFLDIAIKRV